MHNNNLAPIVELLINNLHPTEHVMSHYYSYGSYVREFRTIDLRGPRQQGKTTILTSKHMAAPSIMFVHSTNVHKRVAESIWQAEHIHTFGELNHDRLRQRYVSRIDMWQPIKYECILVDEPAFMTEEQTHHLDGFIDSLHKRQKLSDNFYVLKLGT